jgi:hypothetical protein
MYEASIHSALFLAGHSFDDGQPFHAECYYVVIENERGRRFAHAKRFNGTHPQFCNETGEGPYFPDLRDIAMAQAESLEKRVNAALKDGRPLDGAQWREIDPAYASKEYESQGTEFQRWLEDKESA